MELEFGGASDGEFKQLRTYKTKQVKGRQTPHSRMRRLHVSTGSI